MAEKDTTIPVSVEDSKDTTDIPFQGGKYQTGEIDGATYDDVFGEANEDGPNYRSVSVLNIVTISMKTM